MPGCRTRRRPHPGPAPARRRATGAGLTLLELLAAVAVAALLTSLAIPTFRGLLLRSRMTAQVNALVTHVNLGRSEAVRRNRRVVLCRSASGRACDRAGSWNGGWILFLDRNRDHARGAGEPVLRRQGALGHGLTLRYAAFPANGYLTFQPTGVTNANGTFTFCDARGPSGAEAVIVSRTGRARLSHTRPGGGPLSC